MLEVSPRLGRSFQPGDGGAGSEKIVIISDALWQRRFGGEADALGQQILLNDQPHTVVGVMPRRFRLLNEDEAFWLPVDMNSRLDDSTVRGLHGIGRLEVGVTQTGRSNLPTSGRQAANGRPRYLRPGGSASHPRRSPGSMTPRATRCSSCSARFGFVLLITCANVANLFRRRRRRGQREDGISPALGARAVN